MLITKIKNIDIERKDGVLQPEQDKTISSVNHYEVKKNYGPFNRRLQIKLQSTTIILSIFDIPYIFLCICIKQSMNIQEQFYKSISMLLELIICNFEIKT